MMKLRDLVAVIASAASIKLYENGTKNDPEEKDYIGYYSFFNTLEREGYGDREVNYIYPEKDGVIIVTIYPSK